MLRCLLAEHLREGGGDVAGSGHVEREAARRRLVKVGVTTMFVTSVRLKWALK